MRRLMMGLAATTLILGSCTQDDVTEVNAKVDGIGFEIGTGKTKADVVKIGDLENSAGFNVFATQGTNTTNFIENKAYHFESGEWKWKADDQKWPTDNAGYPINFYAHYPIGNHNLTAGLKEDITVLKSPADQIDYLAAKHENVVARPISNKVTLNFKHMLSKIDFQVVTGPTRTTIVQSIKIKNVGDTRKFDYKALSWMTGDNQLADNSIIHPYLKVGDGVKEFAGNVTPLAINPCSKSLMPMPQNLVARAWDGTLDVSEKTVTTPDAWTYTSQAYIEVVYRVYETATGKDVIGYGLANNHPDWANIGPKAQSAYNGKPLYVVVGYPLPNEFWEMGIGYTYTIYLGTNDASGGILMDDRYVDGDGEFVNIAVIDPDTEEPIDPEEPIVDTTKGIGFIVSVTDWTEEGAEEIK